MENTENKTNTANVTAVSYTHLDVYKRQAVHTATGDHRHIPQLQVQRPGALSATTGETAVGLQSSTRTVGRLRSATAPRGSDNMGREVHQPADQLTRVLESLPVPLLWDTAAGIHGTLPSAEDQALPYLCPWSDEHMSILMLTQQVQQCLQLTLRIMPPTTLKELLKGQLAQQKTWTKMTIGS